MSSWNWVEHVVLCYLGDGRCSYLQTQVNTVNDSGAWHGRIGVKSLHRSAYWKIHSQLSPWPEDMFSKNTICQVLFASLCRWDSGDDARAERRPLSLMDVLKETGLLVPALNSMQTGALDQTDKAKNLISGTVFHFSSDPIGVKWVRRQSLSFLSFQDDYCSFVKWRAEIENALR